MKKVIIFGTEDLAKLIQKYLTRDSPHEIVAFTSHQEFITEKNIGNLPVIPFEKIENEKKNLEKLTKKKILGNKVHYLGFDEDFPSKLQKLEFVYDSSIRNSKDLINSKEMGFFHYDKIIEFPITLMDAYMFTYMKINEEKIIPTFKKTLDIGREVNSDFNVISVIWHDNVLKMKGGRMYEKILEFLSSEEDVEIHRGIDIVDLINRNVS